MSLPFTAEQFFAVFAAYNAAIWPAQLAAYGLGLLAVIALLFAKPAGRAILTALAIMWAFNGIAYHMVFFAQVNPAAYGFGALFLLQAVLFAGFALAKADVQFVAAADARSLLGAAMLAYALIIYEIAGYYAGHGLLAGPLFGVAPCPTTIFTIGMLAFARGRLVAWLAIVPLLWAIIGTSAAVMLGVPEDFGLAAAGVVLLGLLVSDRVYANRTAPKARL